ncbi:MAG: hypothetical protein A3D10_08330 [Omnitrophica WOR_2 bacterium RIFCSPHIGHO2_02_FULL_48_11]|nr:MAG: hypothetical protein A3D10_08330 [Omnitrophica WOR_2 bacterium RIFCSPHIGHO2_02_FULL_48_11]
MRKQFKENIPLIIGLSIPALMIVFVALSIYLPTFFVQPKINFLYSSGGDYYSASRYTVRDHHLAENEIRYPENYATARWPEVRLFVHDVVKNTSREITPSEAQTLYLDSQTESPDGFSVVSGSGDGGLISIFFFAGIDSYYQKYIKRGNFSRKLNLTPDVGRDNYYNNQIRFIGWIIEGAYGQKGSFPTY